MKKKRPASQQNIDAVKPHCITCGSTVGQTSGRTMRKVKAVYDCPKCGVNYCDQCSYEQTVDGKQVQRCLDCGGELEKVL
jgi:predicted RNA-binding Zn-ribbon protein involved in translation (DUF1610 family)